MFWFPGAAIPSVFGLSPSSVLLYLVQMIAETCIFTVTYLLSGGSVLLAILPHLAFNTSEAVVFGFIPEPSPEQKRQIYLLNTLIMWLVALVATRWKRKKLEPVGGSPSSEAAPQPRPAPPYAK